MAPRISVCVPAYNRPAELAELLETALDQDYHDCEIVVCEDASPRGDEIAAVVAEFAAKHPQRTIRLFRNAENLGYDGNLRRLVELAEGDFCFFMGDDDLMCPGALRRVAEVVERHANVGVVLRSYTQFDTASPDEVLETFRYFPDDRLFEPGPETIVTFFRRSTTICGYVVRRQDALALATDRFDGTLLYQLYLSSGVLTRRQGYYVSDVLTKARTNTRFYFGSSKAEQELFRPLELRPEHSLNFMRGAARIARYVDERFRLRVADRILADYANYLYPVLELHARDQRAFVAYAWALARLGYWRSWRFFVYVLALLALGPGRSRAIVRVIKQRLGRTPRLGRFYGGVPVQR